MIKKTPPGAAPEIQGYYAYALFDKERKPPSFHNEHTQEWQTMWLQSYDNAFEWYLNNAS